MYSKEPNGCVNTLDTDRVGEHVLEAILEHEVVSVSKVVSQPFGKVNRQVVL